MKGEKGVKRGVRILWKECEKEAMETWKEKNGKCVVECWKLKKKF